MAGAGSRRRGETNWVAEAITRVGGIVQAAAICRVRQATLYDWKKKGAIRLLAPALRLAKASNIPVERLAAEDE